MRHWFGASRDRDENARSSGTYIVIAAVLMALTCYAAVRWFGPGRQPVLYEATAWLRIDPSDEELAALAMDCDVFAAEFAAIILSSEVLDCVLAQEAIADLPEIASMRRPREFLTERLSVELHHQSELVTITCRWTDQATAARLANGIAEAFFKAYSQEIARCKSNRLDLLQAERMSVENRLATLENASRSDSSPERTRELGRGQVESLRNEIEVFDEQIGYLQSSRRYCAIHLLRSAQPTDHQPSAFGMFERTWKRIRGWWP